MAVMPRVLVWPRGRRESRGYADCLLSCQREGKETAAVGVLSFGRHVGWWREKGLANPAICLFAAWGRGENKGDVTGGGVCAKVERGRENGEAAVCMLSYMSVKEKGKDAFSHLTSLCMV